MKLENVKTFKELKFLSKPMTEEHILFKGGTPVCGIGPNGSGCAKK